MLLNVTVAGLSEGVLVNFCTKRLRAVFHPYFTAGKRERMLLNVAFRS